ncbi:hypothetical protein GEMRC1_002932 [Eukaryota sp. GEM-RC1]
MFIEHRRDILDTLVTMFSNLHNEKNKESSEDTFFEPINKHCDMLATQIAGAFVNLSATLNDSVIQAMRGAGVIKAILPWCKSEPIESPSHNEVVQELCIWCLRNLSRDDGCASSIISSSETVLEMFLECLECSVRAIQDYSLCILANITKLQGEMVVEKWKRIRKLAALIGQYLSSDFAAVQEGSARLLGQLALVLPGFPLEFLQSGHLSDLIDCLMSSSSDVVYSSLCAFSLMTAEEKILERLANVQVFNRIVELLSESDSRIHLKAIQVLKQFVSLSKGRELIFGLNNVEDLFFGLLTNLDSADVSSGAAKIVKSLSKKDERGVLLRKTLKERRDQSVVENEEYLA